MGERTTGTVDDLVADLQRDTVRELRERPRNGTTRRTPSADTPHEVETPPEYVDPGPLDDEDQVVAAFANVEEGKGFYVKIFKLAPLPREYGTSPLLMHTVMQPHLVTDWDVEVHALARQFGWTDGKYAVKLYQERVPGKQGERRITISVPPPDRAAVPPGGIAAHGLPGAAATAVDPFAQLSRTAEVIKQLKDASGSQALTAEAVTKAVHTAYREGVEAARRGAGDAAGGNSGLADVLKSLQAFMPRPTNPLVEVLPVLQQLGLVRVPGTDDPLATLIRLREAGIIPKTDSAGGDSFHKALETITAIVPLIQTLGGGGGSGEPASVMTEVVRVVGPQVGKMIEDVTSTINKALDARRTHSTTLAGRLPIPSVATVPPAAGNPSAPSASSAPFVPSTPAASSAVDLSGVKQSGESTMLPILATLRDMIARNDTDDFPKIREWIIQYANEETYERLLNGSYTYAQLVEYLTPLGGSFLKHEMAQLYFEAFLKWARVEHAQAKAQEIETRCSSCEAEFVFESEAALAKEPSCPDCHQPLVKILQTEASS